jgi:hypothetical protein
MAIKWYEKLRTIKISSLKLSGGFKARLTKPSVRDMAESTGKVGRINLPVVCWRLRKAKHLEVAAGEDRIASELVRNGGKWDTAILVRTFDCDEETEIAAVRAHENAIRRHDNRDEWLAGLAKQEQAAAIGEDSTGSLKNETGEGGGARQEPVSPPPPEALDPPDNVAQAFDGPSCAQRAAGRDTVCGQRLCALGDTCSMAHGDDPITHASRNGYAACGAHQRPHTVDHVGDTVVGHLAPNIPITCQACADLVTKAGSREALHDVPSQAVTVEGPKDKAKRRKKAAELATEATGKPVTTAAVKQAEYRDRKAKGQVNPRQKHDDGNAPPLGALAEEVGRGLLDVHRYLTDAATRLGNLLRKHPELSERFPVDGWLASIKDANKGVSSIVPESVCVFCFGKGEKAACQVCRGTRWGTKQDLKDAPAELRQAAGL